MALRKRQFDPIYGAVPKAVFLEAMNTVGEGQAAKIIKKYEPRFGLKEGQLAKYKVQVERTIRRRDTAEVVVDAKDEDDAEKVANAMDWDEFDWDEGSDDEDDARVICVDGAQ